MLYLSIFVNLGLLGFFKYHNFFIENFIHTFAFFGIPFQRTSLHIILPVGISFYTFQTLSYTIDVYKKQLPACTNFIQFAAFVSFFPQLVAGPIERARNLLPQFNQTRTFSYPQAVEGMKQILWGLFKKVVIADHCAQYANLIFNHSDSYNGSTLLLGAFFFSFQIYGDFSGYSDIAIGTAKLFGFSLMKNFSFPYFSRDVAEFWRRWHISLSTWFRDYIYIPLGGSKVGKWRKVMNTFILFLVSGFWHGPNWTFILWGSINALYFLPLLLTGKNRKNIAIVAHNKKSVSFKDILSILSTFSLITLTWVFFRAENVTHATQYLSEIFSVSLFELPKFDGMDGAVVVIILVGLFNWMEWLGRKGDYAIQYLFVHKSKLLRWSFYSCIVFFILLFAQTEETPFIYFQF